eukprot:11204625-Lingulodinium_polyedra.AAC.1
MERAVRLGPWLRRPGAAFCLGRGPPSTRARSWRRPPGTTCAGPCQMALGRGRWRCPSRQAPWN